MSKLRCKICNKLTTYLEVHHIVPLSRGGKNNDANTIKVCIPCHSKAHDVSFKGQRNGLISEGMIKAKSRYKSAQEWLNDPDNEKLVERRLCRVYEEQGEVEHSFILSLLEKGIIDAVDLRGWVETGDLRINVKRKLYSKDKPVGL